MPLAKGDFTINNKMSHQNTNTDSSQRTDSHNVQNDTVASHNRTNVIQHTNTATYGSSVNTGTQIQQNMQQYQVAFG